MKLVAEKAEKADFDSIAAESFAELFAEQAN